MGNYDVYMPFKGKLGRPLKFKPEELIEKFREYVTWAKKHPIEIVRKVTSKTTKGDTYGSDTEEKKPRRLSIGGFLVFIGADRNWWNHLDEGKRGEDFLRVKTLIREYCESYQKEMAAAEIFNAQIISRLLGLADKKDITSGGEKIDRIIVQTPGEKDRIERMKDLDV